MKAKQDQECGGKVCRNTKGSASCFSHVKAKQGLFFSRQSKARPRQAVIAKWQTKQWCTKGKISARKRSKKQIQRSVPWVSRVEGLTLREAPWYRFKIIVKERLAALDASDHVLQAAACGVDNKTEDTEAVPGTRPFFPEILLLSAQEKLLNTLPSAAPHHPAFSCLCLFCFCRLILLGFLKLLLGFSKLLLGFSKLLLGFSKLLLGFSKLLLGFSKLLAWFRTLLLEDPHQQQQHTNSSSDGTKGVDAVNVIHRVHIQRSHFGAELFSYPFTMQPALIAEGGCEEGPSSWPGQPRYCSS